MNGNTLITKFNELPAFTKIIGSTNYGSSLIPKLSYCTNLTEANFHNIEYLNISFNGDFILGTAIKVLYLPNLKNGANMRYVVGCGTFPSSYTKTEYIIIGDKCESLNQISFVNIPTTMKAIIIKAVTPPTVEEVNWAANYKGNFYVPDESVDVYKADANYANIVSRIKGINSFVTDHPDSGVEDLVYG